MWGFIGCTSCGGMQVLSKDAALVIICKYCRRMNVLSSDEAINDQQILALNQLCKRLNVSVAAITVHQYNTAKNITDLRNLEARLLIGKLSEFQRSPEDIPEACVGYDEKWKGSFYGSTK